LSHAGRKRNLKLMTPTALGQLLGSTQISTSFKYDDSKERYSPRKLIPVNPKTLGDRIHLKRIEANLSQPEVAQKAGVSVRTVRKWKLELPTQPRVIGRH
jgi:DNA-binding transcriptional regulator YiaG